MKNLSAAFFLMVVVFAALASTAMADSTDKRSCTYESSPRECAKCCKARGYSGRFKLNYEFNLGGGSTTSCACYT